MRKIRLLLTGALIAGSMTIAASPPHAEAATCCIPAFGYVSLTAPNANTHIVISGQTVASDQPLTVAWQGQLLSVACVANPWNSWLGYTWSCSGAVTDWWVHLGNATNNVDASRVWSADVHVYGGQGQDTINVHNGSANDTVDCGSGDRARDHVYKDGGTRGDQTPTHCSSGGDVIRNTAPA